MNGAPRTASLLLVTLLLMQSFAVISVTANPTGGIVNTFDGGQATPSITLTAGQTNTGLGIEVPRNVTFESASFLVNAKDEVASPGQVYIDIGQDGVKEWAFEGQGYGNLGHQNSFFNGNLSAEIPSNGTALSPPLFLPFAASIATAQINTSFSPDVNGGLLSIGAVADYVSDDLDNDTRPEIVVLSTDFTTTGFNAGVLSVDWMPTTGLQTSNWTQTCAGATEVDTGDFNDDGYADIVAFDYGSDLACVHFTNSTSGALGAAQALSLSSGSIAGAVGDFNSDGYSDVVSIHSNGIFSLRAYNDKTSVFGNNQTHTVNMNGSTSAAALTMLTTGVFGNNSTLFSAVVTDFLGHSTPLYWVNGAGITENPNHFDGIESQPIVGDVDGDGDLDFIGTNQQGYTIALNTGSQWNTTNVLSAVALTNASIFDHDGDGATSLIVPNPGASDGNSQTIDGNLTVFSVNSTEIGNVTSVVQPWSIPTDAKAVDMNGDGLPEHIISAGDTSLGLFIGAWNQIGMDINNDGQDDLQATGYAGHATYGMTPLYIQDPMGNISSTLAPLMNGLPYTADGFNVRLSSISFSFSNIGDGTFNLSGMDIGYDADFIVEDNPSSAGNLTNIINQQQTAGTGSFVVPLPINSTMSGTFAVSGLIAQYTPGAPNLALPPTPVLSVMELTSERVQIEWQEMMDFGDDLIEFEVFRTLEGGTFDLTSPYSIEGANMFVDEEIVHGNTYQYAVRSLHSFGVTSNMSTPTTLTIPYPSPPAAVANLTVVDTPNDTGGSLDISWDISIDGAVEYQVYIESESIDSIENLTALTTIPHTTTAPTMMLNTTPLGITTIDNEGTYVAVVAFDSYGNATTEFSMVGPVVSLNNSLRSAELTYDLTTTGSNENDGFGLSALDSVYLNITLASGESLLAGESLELTIEAATASLTLSGTTDANGVWQAIAVEDLTELGATFTTFFDEASITIDYLGNAGDATMQPVGATSLEIEGAGLLRAAVTADAYELELDAAGVFNLEIDFSAELPTQNTYLEGLAYTWTQMNATGNTTSTGTVEIKGGQIVLSGTANSTDTLIFTSDSSSSWIVPSIDPLMFTFTGGPDSNTNQTTGSNETNETNETEEPTFPEVTLPGVLECGTAEYSWEDNGTDEAITCTITNPNPFDVFVGFSWITDPITPPPFTFESSSLTGSGPSLTISAEGSTQVEFQPVRNGPSDGLFPGIQGVEYVVYITCSEFGGANPCDSMTTSTASTEGELQWTLGEQPEVQQPVDTTPTENKGSATLIVGGIIGLLVLIGAGAGVVLLRNSEDEDDDWYLEDEEEAPEPKVVEKPTKPTSKSLDQLKSEGHSIDDVDAPEERRPSLFDEFDNEDQGEIESYDVEAALTTEEETMESEEEDDGISVDENGTEWWEDEEGVWWYREEGWEDWAVWEE